MRQILKHLHVVFADRSDECSCMCSNAMSHIEQNVSMSYGSKCANDEWILAHINESGFLVKKIVLCDMSNIICEMRASLYFSSHD